MLTSSRGLNCLKVPYMFQWMSQTYTKKKTTTRGYYHCMPCIRRISPRQPSSPHQFLSEKLSLILLENSFQFNEKDYHQTHGTTMGTKMAVAFAHIFMAKKEKAILRQSSIKHIFWKRFIDDAISVWDTRRNEIEEYQKQRLHSWTRKVQQCQIQQGFYP